MAKLTTLEGDYGASELSSFLAADEVFLAGFSITKLAKKAVSGTKSVVKATVTAPLKVAVAASKAPVTVLKAVGAPKAVTSVVDKVTNIPVAPVKAVEKLVVKGTDTAFKVPEVIVPATAKAHTKVAEFVQRNPYTSALASLALPIPGAPVMAATMAMMSKKGRANIVSAPMNFANRHPVIAGIATGGASTIAQATTKRGRQALAGRKPGFRSAPGLTGRDKDEYLTLKNKKARKEEEEKRLAELKAKGDAQAEADRIAKEKADALKAAQEAAAKQEQSSGGGGGGGGGGGSTGGPETDAGTEAPASPLGPLLLAGGLAALMIL